MFHRALPKLIGERGLSGNEVYGLIEYVMRIEELNRGLDLARASEAEAATRPKGMAPEFRYQDLEKVYERNVDKAALILEEKLQRLEDETVYDSALHALMSIEGTYLDARWERFKRRLRNRKRPKAAADAAAPLESRGDLP
jgi:hypothetical protein